ncbi:hypothetical protein BDV96DRAFT_495882 [Lophiotrema nucula]|uniref:SMP-30/Gluconolactonase/LRE-like region domain-containing protein n=1 Tax=Lophiotrema nucula TaxID=690887 RepID=A0A6A5Z349_9PLEO|nr:hypothetical protein BDV96DRAFT_495882 [Lophiotrema nucula]
MLRAIFVLGLWALPIFTTAFSQTEHTSHKKTRLLYQFPNGTWVENIAVRRNNQLLLTLLTTPDLYALDPLTPDPQHKLIHTFSNATAVFGIAEYAPDIFAVAVGNYSSSSGVTEGSFAMYRVDFSDDCANSTDAKPAVSLIAPVPEAGFINGVCTLSSEAGVLLLGDISRGQVFRFDPQTGVSSLVAPPTNPLVMVGNSTFDIVGVDGLRTLGHFLYAANVGTGVLGKLAINSDGSPQPGAELIVIARADNGTGWDDFALDEEGTVYAVTSSGNTVVRILPGVEQVVIAGDPNSTEIDEPTSAALSRGAIKDKKLFVVTGGGALAPGSEIVGGQVLAIDL